MTLLAVLLLCAAAAGPDGPPPPTAPSPTALVAYARLALDGEPSAGVEDVYKWLFQAARGGEHAAPSEEAARRWLGREWAGLGPPLPGEPLVVPLRPDGKVVRLNLRPFKAAGGDPEALLRAFLQSARGFREEPGLFVAAWRAFGHGLSPEGTGGWSTRAFEEIDRESERAGWPARHHGEAYATARKPAYRVLTGEAAAALVPAAEGTR